MKDKSSIHFGLAGLGFRREIAGEFEAVLDNMPDFIEVAPENWIGVGGKYAKQFHRIAERFPVTLHGLSLNIGGYSALDIDLVNNIKKFITDFDCPLYSEHLSYCGDHGHLYDLMPIPFREDAITRVVERVSRVQDILGMRIVLENVSYYAAPAQDMSEIEFLNEVLNRADCELLLDVNNIYVNSINHRYDPVAFMSAIDPKRVRYMHIAGHYVEAEDLRVDTHGADVIDSVWQLLHEAYRLFGVKPTLLERDFNFPKFSELLSEVDRVRNCQGESERGVDVGIMSSST